MTYARELLEGSIRSEWNPALPFPVFQTKIYAKMTQSQKAPLPQHPYALYNTLKRASNFTTSHLAQVMHLLHETDVKLKSTDLSPRLALERLLFVLCGVFK